MWVGPIIMGGVTELDVVYDTGSDWLVIESKTCPTCEGDKYDLDNSAGNPEKVNPKMTDRNYGSASLSGYEYTDKVCVNLNLCLDKFEFFLIEKSKGIREPIDGILGLSRNNSFHVQKDSGNKSGPLLIEHLAEAEVINANKYNFYFVHKLDGDSWVDLGEPDMNHVKDGETPVTTQLLDPDFFWGFYNTGVAIGTIENSFAYEPYPDLPAELFKENSFYSIIDTGSTALTISVIYFESLIRNLFEYAKIDDWEYTQGVIVTKCKYEKSLPSIFFQIDGAWIEARARDYMFDYEGTGINCILYIMPANMAMNILGMPVHVDYYSMHDPVAGTVQWAPHSTSPKSAV